MKHRLQNSDRGSTPLVSTNKIYGYVTVSTGFGQKIVDSPIVILAIVKRENQTKTAKTSQIASKAKVIAFPAQPKTAMAFAAAA